MALNAEWERHFSSRFLVASRNFRSKDRVLSVATFLTVLPLCRALTF
jgi:hypothetical protein